MPETGFYDRLTNLYRGIAKRYRRSIGSGAYRDLSASDFLVLRYIAAETAPAMSDIAARLSVTQGTLTVAMNRLVKKGYVERSRMERDRRIVRTSLTKAGYGALEEDSRFRDSIEEDYVAALGAERAREFGRMLSELDRYFRKREG